MTWAATEQALEAVHRAEHGVDAWMRLQREGATGAAARGLATLATTAGDLIERVDGPHRRLLAEAMTAALSELSRAPRGDEGAVLAASARLERALRQLIGEVNRARAARAGG